MSLKLHEQKQIIIIIIIIICSLALTNGLGKYERDISRKKNRKFWDQAVILWIP